MRVYSRIGHNTGVSFGPISALLFIAAFGAILYAILKALLVAGIVLAVIATPLFAWALVRGWREHQRLDRITDDARRRFGE